LLTLTVPVTLKRAGREMRLTSRLPASRPEQRKLFGFR